MKKQAMLLLLSSLMLGSCQNVFVSDSLNSSQDSTDSSDNQQESSSGTLDDSSSTVEDSSSSNTDVDKDIKVNEVKDATDFLGSDNDVYRINITTETNELPVDKENYVNGSLNITEQNTNIVKHEDMEIKIKLRGNSTFEADKKPFKIKFESKQALFGLEKAKEWVLLANYYDKANVRNYLAYMTANKMGNLGFQPSYIFVDVYFNGKYYGLFLLTEQMEVNPGRVDIEDNFSASGVSSFLIEADERAKLEYPGYQGRCYVTSGGYDFALKGPDADDYVEACDLLFYNPDATPEEYEEAQEVYDQFEKDTAWLQSFMDDVSDAIYDLDYTRIQQLIDIDSFVDYYLVQEMFKNVDVGSTSQFYVIDQGQETVKLTMGPVWDFDIAAGVVDETSSSTYKSYSRAPLFTRERDYYYRELFKIPEFEQLVKERYSETRNEVFAKIDYELDVVLSALENAQQRNIERWPLTQERKTWVEQNALSRNYYAINSLQGHYEHLDKTLVDRLSILDNAYLL